MALTPADIEKKTFSTALRGYDLDEVDDFLDEVVAALRGLEEDLTQCRARVAELERDPSLPPTAVPQPVAEPVPAPAPAATVDESAVGRALVAAQQAADRLLEEARADAEKALKESRSEAEQILESARTEADTFNRERDQKKAEVEAEMAHMTELVAAVRTRLAVLATSVADKLDEMDAVVSGADLPEEAPEDAMAEEVIDVAAEEEVAPEVIDDGADDAIESVDSVDFSEEGDVEGEAVADTEDEVGSAEIEGLDEAEREDNPES
jgi:DivIVA domain-containing protein